MKKKKKGEIETRKLISAIIVLVVIVVVVIFIASQASGGAISNFLKLFPDFIKPNYSVSIPIPCPAGFVEAGYIDGTNYINLNGKKTNFYIDNGRIFVDTPFNYDYGRDQLIGNINNGIILINYPENLDQREIEFRSLFPEEKDRRLLFQAKIFEGTICLPKDLANKYSNMDKCVLTCAILNGICSSSDVNEKVAFKKFDCPNGQLCYVSESEKILDSNNLHIKKDSYLAEKTLNDIVDLNKFSVNIFDKIKLFIFMNYTEPFCYSFDLDNEEVKLFNGYIDGKNDSYILKSDLISYSGEKILNYAAWNNEKKEKVLVRLKLESLGMGNQYENGEIIKDSEFAWKLQNAPVGSITYVIGLKKEWDIGYFWNRKGQLLITYDYKIVKDSNSKISIYAYDGENRDWHKMYCNKGSVSNFWPVYSMKINDISDTMGVTLDKNCMWSYFEK